MIFQAKKKKTVDTYAYVYLVREREKKSE